MRVVRARLRIVSANPGLRALVERLANHLDLDRRLRARAPRERRRSGLEALDEATTRWTFRYDDPRDAETRR
jgi:hypothetical protein